MRIIDKNTDFYDFYQGVYRDDSITFDRTVSFLLTKELVCECLSRWRSRFGKEIERYRFLLLQVCNTFWLFVVEVTNQKEENGFCYVTDYSVELIKTWKNYNRPRRLISLDIIRFGYDVDSVLRHKRFWMKYDKEKFFDKADVLVNAINTEDFDVRCSMNSYTVYHGDGRKDEKRIPLLKACGVAPCIEPLEIYLAFEEYFSLEKSSQERTASKGLTDKEKVGNHGFDVKTSFRGKS